MISAGKHCHVTYLYLIMTTDGYLAIHEMLSNQIPVSIHIPSLNHYITGGQPTLIELVRFRGRERRINIPQEISTKYLQFGILLLEDTNGARVRNMEHKHRGDAEQINMEILQEWVSGRGRKPVSWATLTEVLRDVELSELASEIEAVKLQTNSESNAWQPVHHEM